MTGSHPDTNGPTEGVVSGNQADASVDFGHDAATTATNASDTAAAPGQETGADTAKSPGADGADEPKTLLEATRRALDKGKSPAPDGENKDQAKPSDPAKPAEGEADASKTDAEKDPPFHQHPRWQEKLRAERALKADVAALEPDAKAHRDVLGFMDANRLSHDDVRSGFAIMAAIRTDPAKAWELLQPTIKSIREFLGHDLPADLQAKVEDGSVDEDTARETTRLRNERIQQGQREEYAQRQAEARAQADTGQAAGTAVDAWLNGQASADPDFSHVSPLLEGEILRLQRVAQAEGKPFNTAESAVAMTTAAYANVKANLTRLRPAPQAIAPRPRSSAPAGGTTPPAPTNLRDAIRQAVR